MPPHTRAHKYKMCFYTLHCIKKKLQISFGFSVVLGNSVIGAATTTILSMLVLLLCNIHVFVVIGAIISATLFLGTQHTASMTGTNNSLIQRLHARI